MITFEITPPDLGLDQEIQHAIDIKTKPLGALGQLESIANQICRIQQTTQPKLTRPSMVVFAADHGIAKEGVSAYPQEVTHQMALNFLNGGAAINVFCEQHDIDLQIVDAGVNFDFGNLPDLIDAKVAMGTQNSQKGQAMSEDQLQTAIASGADIVQKIYDGGCNVIGFGEMGIGNTSAASLIMSHICQLPIELCVGRGTGVDDEGWRRKVNTLVEVQTIHADIQDIYSLLQAVGGFEIAMIMGGMMKAASLGMVVLVDGFIATAAFLCAHAIESAILPYAIFCHQSDESGHQQMLDYLKVEPVLKMKLRLGEGTGCALAYPLLRSSVDFMNKMASFEDAGVANKS